NMGNKKVMKARSKNPYKFEGDVVREIPLYQRGGLSSKQLFDFLFDDEEEELPKSVPTAPTSEDIQPEPEMQPEMDMYDEDEAMLNEIIYTDRRYQPRNSRVKGNPYTQQQTQSNYMGEILSSGQFGNQNVGEFGRRIYGELAS